METNSNNSENTKSKIEQIRIDLEKKLAALEKAKLDVDSNTEPIASNEVVEDVPEIENEVIEVEEHVEVKKSFIDQITDIEKSTEVIKKTAVKEVKKVAPVIPIVSLTEKVEEIEEEDTLFEIGDTIEQIESVDKEEKEITPINKIIDEKPLSTVVSKKEEVKQEKEKKVFVPPIITKSNNIENQTESIDDLDENEEESKGSKLNYLIYGLSALLFISLIYFAWDYLSDKNDLEKQQTNQMISEYENRRYLDSIELADANNQLLDIQSQRFLDSIALVNQIQVNKPKAVSPYNNQRLNSVNNKKNTTASRKKVVPTVTAQDVTNYEKQRNEELRNDIAANESTPSTSSIVNELDKPLQTELVDSSSSDNEDTKVANEVVKIKPKIQTLSTIEVSPVYPGCGSGTESQRKKCLMSKISKFVANNFDSDLANDLGLELGRKRINVSFLIDKNGEPTVLKVRAQHEKLKKEALRVVNSLPKMKPGKVNGKVEPVLYNLPIVYDVDD